MTHKEKVKLANKIRTKKEKADGVGLFETEGWKKRREAKQIKELEKRWGKDWRDHVSGHYPYHVTAKGYPAKIKFN